MKESIVADKSKAFSLRIIKLYQYLEAEKREYVMAKQILASGTSIGANIREALHAQSRKDFFAKMYVSYKEAGPMSINSTNENEKFSPLGNRLRPYFLV